MKQFFTKSITLFFGYMLLLVIAITPNIAAQNLTFEKLYTHETHIFDEGAAEIATYDSSCGRLAFVNAEDKQVVVLDINDAQNPTEVFKIDVTTQVTGGAVNSVSSNQNGVIAVAVEADNKEDNGYVVFYNITGTSESFESKVEVGVLPDMVIFTPDGNTVLSANEGEPLKDYSIDPEGSVSIIDVSGGFTSPSVTPVNFNHLDGKEDSLRALAIRIFGGIEKYDVVDYVDENPAKLIIEPGVVNSAWQGKWFTLESGGDPIAYQIAHAINSEGTQIFSKDYSFSVAPQYDTLILTTKFSGDTDLGDLGQLCLHNPSMTTVSKDMEPEYIAVSSNSQTAYVSCQENNALVIIDIPSATITEIRALGFKDHNVAKNSLDASNKNGVGNFMQLPIKGMFMPDAIVVHKIGSDDYIFTANEGDSREYDSFVEETRMKELQLDQTVFPSPETLLSNDSLGRLKTTVTLGDANGDGLFEELYSYGARSFSIFDATGSMIWDSGNDIEKITYDSLGSDFNSDNAEFDTGDDRSDDKGPEPEAVAVGKIGEKYYAFIGLERVGGEMVYDVTTPSSPEYITYFNNRDFSVDFDKGGDDWATVGTSVGDLGPECVIFIPAESHTQGKNLLVVSNEVSGTVSIFEITDEALAVGDDLDVKPNTFVLQQNYPNPFNPTATIKYSISKAGLVTLNIYDMLGRSVGSLVNRKQAAGNYSVNFDASKLASGIYFYQLKSSEFVETKKMMLVK